MRFGTQSPTMSTMPATGGHSKPCCNVPPIVTKGYKPKGAYEEIGGYKTCTYAVRMEPLGGQ